MSQIADGVVDKVLLFEQQRGFDTGWKSWSKFLQRLVHLRGKLPGVKTRCLGDGHDHAISRSFFRTDAHGRITAHGLDAPDDLRHVTDRDGTVVDLFDDRAGDVIQLHCHG